MNNRSQSVLAWRAARQRVAVGGMLTIPKSMPFPHPRDAGARPTISWPVGQLADYALELESDAVPLLIREFGDRYEAFIEGIQLAGLAVQFAESHPEAAMYLGGALIGATIGIAISNRREGALLGAGLGMVIAAAVEAHLRRGTDHQSALRLANTT